MLHKLALAVMAIAVLATPAAARRHQAQPMLPGGLEFCGARYCGAVAFTPAEFGSRRPRARRNVRHASKREARHIEAVQARPRSPAAALGAALAGFRAPIGAVCGIVRAAASAVAAILEPARPGLVWIKSASGAKAIVERDSAPRFVALLRLLEETGYRIREMGGYAYRRIAGTRHLSKHAFGRALDVNQVERDRVSVPMNRRLVSKLAARAGLCSGGDWRHGDLGHFEVCGRAFAGLHDEPSPAKPIVLASADPSSPAPEIAAGETRTTASTFNDRRTACPPYRLQRGRLEVAHPTLPCGTRVSVRNLENGREREAVVADKGPCTTRRCLRRTPRIARERKLDLDPDLASALGSNGLTPVAFRVLPRHARR